MTGIINKPLLLHLVGCLYYLYQWCTVKQISDNEIYLLIKYIKSVLWRVAKCLSYIVEVRCLTVKHVERKVMVTFVQTLRLCTGRAACRGSRGIALLFHDHGNRRGGWVSVTPWPLFTPRKDPVPIVQEGEWAPGPVWTGAENLLHTGIRSLDRPASSQSLYRLRYPAHRKIHGVSVNSIVSIINHSFCVQNILLAECRLSCPGSPHNRY